MQLTKQNHKINTSEIGVENQEKVEIFDAVLSTLMIEIGIFGIIIRTKRWN